MNVKATNYPNHLSLKADIKRKIKLFDQDLHPLLGLRSDAELMHLVQVIYTAAEEVSAIIKLVENGISSEYIDPKSSYFNPLLAALAYTRDAEIEEACWLLFLSCYIGKHSSQKWNLARNIYCALEEENPWTWERVNLDAQGFQQWIVKNQHVLATKGSFGEIHKYSNLDSRKAIATGSEILKYIYCIQKAGGHSQMFQKAIDDCQGQRTVTFDMLYRSMNEACKLNKQIIFNFLALIGNLKIFHLEAPRLYLNDFLMQKKAARWLLEGNKKSKTSPSELNETISKLADCLKFQYGAQILHLALSKWIKELF